MININEEILQALERSKSQLSDEGIDFIKEFIVSQIHTNGGFIDRSGNPDPYYSVFGYSLTYVFDINLDVDKHIEFLRVWEKNNKIDFVHAVSLLRCHYILNAIKLRTSQKILSKGIEKISFLKNKIVKRVAESFQTEFSFLFDIVESYKSEDNGYNHFNCSEKNATTYANFLALGLYTDINIEKIPIDKLYQSIKPLEKENGSFVNEVSSTNGVTSSTSAGIILKYLAGENVDKNINWLKQKQNSFGGFSAAENISLADLLSTATALTTIRFCGSEALVSSESAEEFIISHWDDDGGFFGSLADMKSDCEYTYYGLLALGLI